MNLKNTMLQALVIVSICVFLAQCSDVLVEEDPIIQQLKPSSTFGKGPFPVHVSSVTKSPAPGTLFVPQQGQKFPVIYFHHGFQCGSTMYSQLLSLVSSHGFIIFAIDFTVMRSDATKDIQAAARVIEWLPENLASQFPKECSDVVPDFEKLVLMGHSKGGKIAFALALHIRSNISLPFSAIVGLDPVGGTTPDVLTYRNNSFKLPFPTLVIGTGYGPVRRSLLIGPCAPAKVGHKQFFMESSPLAFDLTPRSFGHMDFVDDKLSLTEELLVLVCKSGSSRADMRNFTSGTVVAFLNAALFGDKEAFKNIILNPQSAPVVLADPLYKM